MAALAISREKNVCAADHVERTLKNDLVGIVNQTKKAASCLCKGRKLKSFGLIS